MQENEASRELAFVRGILERTQRRLDPHAFHFVGWGAVVLVWYPLENLFRLQGRPAWWSLVLGAASLATGVVLGIVGEHRLRLSPEPVPEDTVFSRQVKLTVLGALVPAALLTAIGPPLGLVPGPYVPIVWGFAYAVLAYFTGVVYSRAFLWAGVVIFAASVVALAAPLYAGFIVGPVMGLGILVPGLATERRLRARRRAGSAVAA